jgi:hypothetical protein
VVIDVAPYFGHPEINLALVNYFDPVPDDVFEAYQDTSPRSIRASRCAVSCGVSSATSLADRRALLHRRVASARYSAPPAGLGP